MESRRAPRVSRLVVQSGFPGRSLATGASAQMCGMVFGRFLRSQHATLLATKPRSLDEIRCSCWDCRSDTGSPSTESRNSGSPRRSTCSNHARIGSGKGAWCQTPPPRPERPQAEIRTSQGNLRQILGLGESPLTGREYARYVKIGGQTGPGNKVMGISLATPLTNRPVASNPGNGQRKGPNGDELDRAWIYYRGL